MAIVIIKDSEKNNKRFAEKRSKLINDQVDIISESELGELLTQEQAPVSETINSAVDSERTVVAHFLLGHKKDIYLYGNIRNISSPPTFGGLLPYSSDAIVGEDASLSTANEYLTAQPSNLNHWGITSGKGLNAYLYNSGVLRNVQHMVETFADYNPFLHDLSLNGFAIDEMYVDRNVIKNIHIAPQGTDLYGLTNNIDGSTGNAQQSLTQPLGILQNPSDFQLRNTTSRGAGYSDASAGGVFVSFEFNTDSEDVISAPLITDYEVLNKGNQQVEVSSLSYQERFVNLTTGETKNQTPDYYSMLDASAEKIIKQTRDFKLGYRYFFEVKKHTIPTLEYAQNRNFITKNSFAYSNTGPSLSVLLATLDPVSTTASGVNLLYDQGFVPTFRSGTSYSFQINSTPPASGTTINLSNGDVWNMKSGALVSSVVPAALPNELSVHSFVTRTNWNPVYMYEYFGGGDSGIVVNTELFNQKNYDNSSFGLLTQLYKDKANMPESFGQLAAQTFYPLADISLEIYSMTGMYRTLAYDAAVVENSPNLGVTMSRFSTMGALEFLFTMSGQSDILDAGTSTFNAASDTTFDTTDSLTSSLESPGSSFTFTDRFGTIRTVYSNTGGTYHTTGAPRVFTANRASTAAEIYEVKIIRYPSATVDVSNPIYSEAAGGGYGYGGYGYDGYGYSGGASATVIGYDTFKKNVVDKYTIAGVPFGVGTWATGNSNTYKKYFFGPTPAEPKPNYFGPQILDWDGGVGSKKAIFVY